MTTFDSNNKHADIVLSDGNLSAEFSVDYFPCFGFYGNAPDITVNFGASAFAHTPPFGFSAYGSSVVLDPANKATEIILSGSDLIATRDVGNAWRSVTADIGYSTGKKYFEITLGNCNTTDAYLMLGLTTGDHTTQTYPGDYDYGFAYYQKTGNKYSSSNWAYGSIAATADVVMCAINYDTSEIWWGINGIWFASGDPTAVPASSNPAFRGFVAVSWKAAAVTDFLQTPAKRYWEVEIDRAGTAAFMIGIGTETRSVNLYVGDTTSGWSYYGVNGYKYHSSSYAFGDAYDVGDIIGIALDMSTGKLWFSKNGVWQASGDPSAGTGEAFSAITGIKGAWVSLKSTGKVTLVFEAPFNYTVPTDFDEYEQPAGARITHAVREVLRDGDPRTRITHAVREVLRDGDPRVRVTHVVREVLRTGFWKETTLFDGKVFIKSAVTTLFDGKAELKFAPTNFLDGKTVIIHDNDSVKSSFFLVF